MSDSLFGPTPPFLGVCPSHIIIFNKWAINQTVNDISLTIPSRSRVLKRCDLSRIFFRDCARFGLLNAKMHNLKIAFRKSE